MWGTLYGIGVGPGDPELMTIKAARILQQVPVIAYTVDADGASLARQTASACIPPAVVELPLRFSMSKQRETRVAARQAAARQVCAALAQGQDVAFITEGDPLLYSTFQHLLAEMPAEAAAEVKVQICPGVSSLSAAAAAAHFPLALEDQRMLVASAREAGPEQLSAWLRQFDVLVLFKVYNRLPALLRELERSGCLANAVLVERASLQDQAVIHNLADWDGRQPAYFSILLVRGVPEQPEAL
jgi:precorrin-2/cobalt-factor-2 C20-methyltransferase